MTRDEYHKLGFTIGRIIRYAAIGVAVCIIGSLAFVLFVCHIATKEQHKHGRVRGR